MFSNSSIHARSFRDDPRMRRMLAGLAPGGGRGRAENPASRSLYWLIRSRRPRLAAVTGHLPDTELMVIACALADCGGKLLAEPGRDDGVRETLAAAGIDWILRSEACGECIRSVRPVELLVIGDSHRSLAPWADALAPAALILAGSHRRDDRRRIEAALREVGPAGEAAWLKDGRRRLLVASREDR
jgi:hypothetical protein